MFEFKYLNNKKMKWFISFTKNYIEFMAFAFAILFVAYTYYEILVDVVNFTSVLIGW